MAFMNNQQSESAVDELKSELYAVENKILKADEKQFGKLCKDLIIVQNRLYAQIEALTWLSRKLTLSASLPPLRGWAASPDVLLRLHEYIIFQCPKVVVECGSGSSTLVIADALRQNGAGVLISLEHLEEFGCKTRAMLEREGLNQWVDLRIAQLEDWDGTHLNDTKDETVKWYSSRALTGLQNIDLLFVDGPPGKTCKYARYPALPALIDYLAPGAQIWMDDTVRQEEIDIINDWKDRYGYNAEFFSLEKGLGILTPNEYNLFHSEQVDKNCLFNKFFNSATLLNLKQHIEAKRPKSVLQFGVSAVTIPLAGPLTTIDEGQLICLTESSDEAQALRGKAEIEGIDSVLSILTSQLETWQYQHLSNCDGFLKQWFSERILDSLPILDWVIIDGHHFRDHPYSYYPALPSVLEKMDSHAELWILGAQDSRVQEVVTTWCEYYPVKRNDDLAHDDLIRITL